MIDRLSLSKTQELEAGIYSQALREVLPPPEEPEPEYLTRVYGMDSKNDWAFFSHKNGVRRSQGILSTPLCLHLHLCLYLYLYLYLYRTCTCVVTVDSASLLRSTEVVFTFYRILSADNVQKKWESSVNIRLVLQVETRCSCYKYQCGTISVEWCWDKRLSLCICTATATATDHLLTSYILDCCSFFPSLPPSLTRSLSLSLLTLPPAITETERQAEREADKEAEREEEPFSLQKHSIEDDEKVDAENDEKKDGEGVTEGAEETKQGTEDDKAEVHAQIEEKGEAMLEGVSETKDSEPASGGKAPTCLFYLMFV